MIPFVKSHLLVLVLVLVYITLATSFLPLAGRVVINQILNKLKLFLYFLIIGWIGWVFERIASGNRAKKELTVKNYELQKEVIKNEADNEDLDKLVNDTNKLYRKGGGDDTAH